MDSYNKPLRRSLSWHRATRVLLAASLGLASCVAAGDVSESEMSAPLPGDEDYAEPEIGTQSQAIVETHDFDDQLMNWGMGYNSGTGESTGAHCLAAFGEPTATSGSQGQIVDFQIKVVESQEELEKHLGVSASGSGSFGWGSVSASAKFSSDYKMNSYSLYVVASTRVVNSTKWITPTKLNEYSETQYLNNFEEFTKRCGDQFLTGITAGGQFHAVFELQTKSEQEKTEFDASISASGAGSWSASAQFSSALNNVTKNKQWTVKSFQIGGIGKDAQPPIDDKQIIERAQKLPTIVAGEGARGIQATFNDYSSLEIPHVDPEMLERRKDYLAILKGQIDDNNLEIVDRDYIIGHPQQFEKPDANLLRNEKAKLQAQILEIRGLASRCRQDIRDCEEMWADTVELKDLPRRLSRTEQQKYEDAVTAAEELRDLRIEAQQKLNEVLVLKAKVTCGPDAKKNYDAIVIKDRPLDTFAQRAKILLETVNRLKAEVANLELIAKQAADDKKTVDSYENQGDDAVAYADLAVDSTKPLYKMKAEFPCDVELYNEKADSAKCGTKKVLVAKSWTKACTGPGAVAPTNKCPGGRLIEDSLKSKVIGTCGTPKGGTGKRTKLTWTCEVDGAKTCRHKDFGVESYESCRHKDFGLEKMVCK
jgi:hypothetical protein